MTRDRLHQSSYGDKGEDCIWVKNFQLNALYNLTLTSSVSDADIVLKNAAWRYVLSGSNGVYQVRARVTNFLHRIKVWL